MRLDSLLLQSSILPAEDLIRQYFRLLRGRMESLRLIHYALQLLDENTVDIIKPLVSLLAKVIRTFVQNLLVFGHRSTGLLLL